MHTTYNQGGGARRRSGERMGGGAMGKLGHNGQTGVMHRDSSSKNDDDDDFNATIDLEDFYKNIGP